MAGRRVGYPTSLRGSQSLFGTTTQIGEMPTLVKLHASDTLQSVVLVLYRTDMSNVPGHVQSTQREGKRKRKNKRKKKK